MKVVCFGHFGSTNPGNESTLLAFASRLRARSEDVELRLICTNPDAARSRYGIDAIPITTRTIEGWDRELALSERVPTVFRALAAELGEYRRALRALARTDLFVVPGTGLVSDAFGLSSWGPYSQLKWVAVAKLRGAKVSFVSVGAGPLRTPLGRAFARAALSLADYRSYRDEASRDEVLSIGVRADDDPVYPDLVFGLPERLLDAGDSRSEHARRVVGLGLMEEAGKYSGDPSPERHAAYLQSLATFAQWLLEHDYDIRLLLGDADTTAIDEFRSALEARLPDYERERVVSKPIESVADVTAAISSTDIVVATRFHNVLLSMLLKKPVISLSFHHKCAELMDQMQLSEYRHDIKRIDAERLIAQFGQLERDRDAVTQKIADGIQRARAALDDQDDRMLAA